MNGLADLPQANLRPLHDLGNILDPQRRSVRRFENGLLNILHIAKETYFADVDLLLPLLNKAAAGVDVVVGQLLFHLADAQSEGDEPGWVDPHLVFAGDAAETGNVHHTRDGLELLFQRPVLIDFNSMLS